MGFLFDIAFGVELIALAVGVVLLVWSYRADKGRGRGLAKVFGYIITIAAALVLLCTTMHGCKAWNHGYFSGHGGGPGLLIKKIQRGR